MDNTDYTRSNHIDSAAQFDSGGQGRPPVSAPAPKDSVSAYIDRNLDVNMLAGDIKAMLTERIQSSIPDDKKLMLDLLNQVGELTNEVKELRKQMNTEPYAVFTCPSGQMKDITKELEEIKALLQNDTQSHELTAMDIDPIALKLDENEDMGTEEPPEQHLVHPLNTEAPHIASPPPTEQTEGTKTAVSEQSSSTVETPAKEKKAKKKSLASVLGNVLFYVVMVTVVVGAFLVKSGNSGSPTVIAGYSAFTVLSSSMEDTYPKGSLIITHSVDANELKIGDDITYMSSATSSITHRIIGITENYLNTGARAFETQGTMNEKPDKEPVAAANVVGKVIFCSVTLGRAASFASANWPLLLFFVVVLGVLLVFLRWNFRRSTQTGHRRGA